MIKKSTITLLLLSTSFVNAKVLTEKTLVNSVKENFPLIKAEILMIEEQKANLMSKQGVFDHKIVGKTYAQPEGGYERQYHDFYIDAPIENTPFKLFAGYRIGRGDWPVYYQEDLTNRDGEERFGFSVPILRDFGIDKNRLGVYQAQLDVQKQMAKKDLTQIKVIYSARDAYWEWVKSALILQINRVVLDNAKVRHEAIIKQAALGDVEKIKITENWQQILNRKNYVQLSEKNYQQAVNQLAFFYRNKQGKMLTIEQKMLPKISKKLADYTLKAENLDYLYQHNPNLETLRIYQKQLDLVEKYAINSLRPKVDLKFYTEEDHGAGNKKLGIRSYNLALNYEFPLRQREAKGKIAAVKQKKLANSQKEKYIKNEQLIDVKNSLWQLDANKTAYALEAGEVAATTKVLQAEIEKFSSGGSSLFVVNQREQMLANEQKTAATSLIKYYQTKNKLEALCYYKSSCIKKLFKINRQ